MKKTYLEFKTRAEAETYLIHQGWKTPRNDGDEFWSHFYRPTELRKVAYFPKTKNWKLLAWEL